MKASELVASVAGSAVKRGAFMTVKSATWASISSLSLMRINMFLANIECHASSVITLSEIRYSGSAPA